MDFRLLLAHRDLEKVRRICNELERRWHNPLLFFLKVPERQREMK